MPLDVVVERPGVTVRAEPGLEAMAPGLADAAAGDLRRIGEDLARLPRLDRVEVRLVKHSADIASVAPAGHGAPDWAVGTAYPEDGVVVVAARGRDGELLEPRRTLTHELAHMALARALGDREPRWLTEGFAYLHSSDVSLARYATLVGATLSGRLMRLAEIEVSFPAREDEAHLAYAQSYDFVAWLAHRGRWPDEHDDGNREAFRQLLAELGAGKSVDAAARAAFGVRLVDLEAEWLESLRGRYFLIPVGMVGALVWVLGAVLLVIGWWRRRRQAQQTRARWEAEDSLDPPTGAAGS